MSRTAKDLEARGFRLVGIGRAYDYRLGGYRPPSYTLRKLGDSDAGRWWGLIEGRFSDRQAERARRASYRRLGASYYTAKPRLQGKRGIARRPIPGQFKTTAEAAHALLDRYEERERRLRVLREERGAVWRG